MFVPDLKLQGFTAKTSRVFGYILPKGLETVQKLPGLSILTCKSQDDVFQSFAVGAEDLEDCYSVNMMQRV